MNVHRIVRILIAALLFAQVMTAQVSDLIRYEFSPGYGPTQSPTSLVVTAVGQVLVGSTQTGGSMVQAGFLSDTLLILLPSKAEPEDKIPTTFLLGQNYPNPFNPSTTIQFSVPQQEIVTLKVLNLLGEEVTSLVSNELSPGTYTVRWDAGNKPSGVYFYRLQSASYSETKKLLLLR